MLQELGFTKFGKCEVLENVKPSLVSEGNGNEEIDILALYLAPHDVTKVELQEGITMHEEKKTWEENKTHVSMEVLHVPKTMGLNSNIVDDHMSGSIHNNNFFIGASSLDLEKQVLVQGMVKTFDFDNLALHESSPTLQNLNVLEIFNKPHVLACFEFSNKPNVRLTRMACQIWMKTNAHERKKCPTHMVLNRNAYCSNLIVEFSDRKSKGQNIPSLCVFCGNI
jgi:hypothetical protein